MPSLGALPPEWYGGRRDVDSARSASGLHHFRNGETEAPIARVATQSPTWGWGQSPESQLHDHVGQGTSE